MIPNTTDEQQAQIAALTEQFIIEVMGICSYAKVVVLTGVPVPEQGLGNNCALRTTGNCPAPEVHGLLSAAIAELLRNTDPAEIAAHEAQVAAHASGALQ